MKFDAECVATNERISVPNIKIKDEKKRAAGIWALGSIGFTLVLTALLIIFIFVLGLGTSTLPLRVYSGKTFEKQVEKAKFVTLYKDIEINDTIEDSEAIIEGNGHTITLSTPMFSSFDGELRNVKIVFNTNEQITKDCAVILDNKGLVENVIVTAKLNFKEETEEDNVYVCALAVNNSGEINKCEITIESNSPSNGEGNAYVSGI